MVAEVSSVVAALMACISAYFSMMAATVGVRHWRHVKRRKHDLIFVVSPDYLTWNIAKIQADMKGLLPNEQGCMFPVSKNSDVGLLLDSLIFVSEIVDTEAILFGDLNASVCIKNARDWFMRSKWFSMVDYTHVGRKRLKQELKVDR